MDAMTLPTEEVTALSKDEFILLRDGDQVLVRPLAPAERPAAAALFSKLLYEGQDVLSHAIGAGSNSVASHATSASHVVVAEHEGRIVGLALYRRLRDSSRAEMEGIVEDVELGRGIGTALVERLCRDAREEGITRVVVDVLVSNQAMLTLLQDLGFLMTRKVTAEVVEVEIVLAPEPAHEVRADARMHIASTASLAPIFLPRSIAVVGASRRTGSIGHEVFRNLLRGNFPGSVFPVNPTAPSVAAVRAYPSVSAIPERIDLAVIVVPAPAVLPTVQDCLDSGVRGVVVISAGFAEVGEEGRRRQNELVRLCRSHGVRLIGPNCMGVLVNGEAGAMNATFAPTLPPPGAVAMSSQSGALGIAILEQAQRLGLGISSFVSVGNTADVSPNDLLEYWEDDAATSVILLYLESFGNPRRFSRLARRVGMRKPIIAVKGGRSQAGRRAAASHTAALAGANVAVDTLFHQAGVVRCDVLEELFEVATLLAHQPLPAGNRVGIVTNAGGLGILCADACEANGLQLPVLSNETQAALRALLPAEAAVANPVDMLAAASGATYAATLRQLLADPSIDAVIALFIPPLVTPAAEVAASLLSACTPPPEKPVLACFVGGDIEQAALRGTTTIPLYHLPESAARALGHAAARTAWLRRPVGQISSLKSVHPREARAVVEQALAREERPWLLPDEVRAVLRAYGVAMPSQQTVRSPEEAAEAFRRLGGPVAVKLVSRKVLHKTDVGGVYLDVRSAEAAAEAYRAIEAGLEERGEADAMDGALVQPMITGGVECLVGVVTDPIFGPLIAFGLGGVLTEVIGDVAFRLHPLTDVDADELIHGVKASALLNGYRGSPPSDIAALRDLLLRVSQLVEDLPEVHEIDINPVMVRAEGHGVLALDARIRIGRSTQ